MRLKKLAIVPLVVLGLLSGGSSHAAPLAPEKTHQTLTTANYSGADFSPPEALQVVEVPVPREDLLEAALNQVGVAQDCTDLVQNALAALGYTERRDQGGFDFGVQDVAYTFAVQVPAHEALPGDIATIGPNNGGHVWIILDPETNMGVHGGWQGANTVVGDAGVPITEHTVYRLV